MEITNRQPLAYDSELLASLFANVGAGTVYSRLIRDDEGRPIDLLYLEINEAYEQNFDCDRKDAIGHRATELFPFLVNGFSDWIRPYYEVTVIGKPLVYEAQWPANSRWFDLVIYPLKNDHFITFIKDITERKQAEEEQGRQAKLIELSPDATMGRELDGTILFWSEGARVLYGWRKEEAVGQASSTLLSTEFPEPFENILASLKENGRWAGELHQWTKDGRELVVESRWLVYLAQSNKPEIFESNIDITERKRAEEALRRKTEELDRYFNNGLDLLCIADTDGHFIRLNAEWARTLGYSLEELLGKRILDLVHPDDVEKTTRAVKQLSDQNVVLNFTNRYRCKDGSYRWFEWRSYPEGKFFYAVVRDVTERQRIEDLKGAHLQISEYSHGHTLDEVLQRTLDEAETLTESKIGFLHFVADDQETLQLQMWSTNTIQRMCTAEGKGQHYPISKAGVWVDCIHAMEPVIHNDVAGLRHRKGYPPGHTPVIRELVVPVIRDGKVRTILGVGNKENDYSKRDVETLSELADLVWDITERKRYEEDIQRSRQMLQLILESVPVPVFWKDLESRYIGCNSLAAKGAGLLDPSEIVGKTDYELAWRKSADEYRADDREIMESGIPKMNYEEPQDRPDGKKLWLKTNKVPLRGSDGRIIGVLGTYEDITDQKELEEALRKSNEELQQFAYVASHDLQEPLRMISSYLGLLDKKYGSGLPERAKEYMATANDSAVRMRELINDLLAYSRLDSKPIEPVEVDMNEVLGKVLATLKVSINEANAQVAVGPLPTVWGDELQMGQLLQNLISNALKFHADSSVRIEVCSHRQARDWIFSVKDNGIGIDQRYSDKLFKMFSRLHTKDEYLGTGIGLAVCKKIIERHGGKIWFESEVGKGTTFYFSIPA